MQKQWVASIAVNGDGEHLNAIIHYHRIINLFSVFTPTFGIATILPVAVVLLLMLLLGDH